MNSLFEEQNFDKRVKTNWPMSVSISLYHCYKECSSQCYSNKGTDPVTLVERYLTCDIEDPLELDP